MNLVHNFFLIEKRKKLASLLKKHKCINACNKDALDHDIKDTPNNHYYYKIEI
jgi:hypothetical protein